MTSKVEPITDARRPPNAGKGRKAGVPNKTTSLLKEAILLAAEQHGKDGAGKDGLAGYCQHLAAEEPKAFATLLGKVLPMQVTMDGKLPLQPVINLTIGTKEQRDAAVSAALRADQ